MPASGSMVSGFFASGGYVADFANNSLFAQYRPDLLHLPITNGERCTGDAVNMGEYAPNVSVKWVALVSKSLVSMIFASGGCGADFI